MPTFGAATTSAGSTTGTGPTVSGSDTIGIVTLHDSTGSGSNPSAVTWGGNSMTRLTPDADRTVHVFYIANPSSGGTVSATWSPSHQHGMIMAYWTDADTPTNNGDGTCSGTACEVTATTPGNTTSGSALVLATSWRGAGAHNDALGSWEVNGSATGVSEAADVPDSGLGDDLRFGMGYDDDGATGSTDSMSATPEGSRDRAHDGTVFEIPAAASGTTHEEGGSVSVALTVDNVVGDFAHTEGGSVSVAVTLSNAIGALRHEGTGSISASVSTSSITGQRTAIGTLSLSIATTLSNAAAIKTAKEGGSSSLSVSLTSAGEKAAQKGQASLNMSVTASNAVGLHTGIGDAGLALSVLLENIQTLKSATEVASSSIVVTVSARGSRRKSAADIGNFVYGLLRKGQKKPSPKRAWKDRENKQNNTLKPIE